VIVPIPKKPGVLRIYGDLPEGLRKYLQHFPNLAAEFPWEISLSYLFAQIELAQNKAVHGIIVRKHRVDTRLARRTIDDFHMTRKGFRDLYQKISGKKLSKQAVDFALEAESIRDKILHGKPVNDAEKRKAVIAALNYANALNEQVNADAGFRPCGDM